MHHHDQAPHADSHGHGHGHGHSLAEDMATLRRLLARRSALKWFAGTGTLALLSGCGNAESSDDVVIVTDVTPTLASTATPTSTSTATTTATTCIADPTETAGPYPADGYTASAVIGIAR